MGFHFKKLGLVIGFLSFCEIAFAVTIVVIIAQQLWPTADATVCDSSGCVTYTWGDTCLMTNTNVNVCGYGYATSAIAIIVSLFTLFAACLPSMVSLILTSFLSLWWLAYSITATVYNNNVSNETGLLFPNGYPRGNYRNMVIALSWTTAACCILTVPLSAMMSKEEKSKPRGQREQVQEFKTAPPQAAIV